MTTKPRSFIPNSFQTPNSHVDYFMHLLTGEEYKVLSYTARRIYGFHRRQDRISMTQYANGKLDKEGNYLDHGTGLGETAIRSAVNKLIEFGLLIVVAPNNKRNSGTGYALQLDHKKIRFELLEQRKDAAKEKQKQASLAAQRTKMAKNTPSSDEGGIVSRGGGGSSDEGAIYRNKEETKILSDTPSVVSTNIPPPEDMSAKEAAQTHAGSVSPLPAVLSESTKANTEEPSPLPAAPPLPKKERPRDPLFDSIAKLQFGIADTSQMPTVKLKNGKTRVQDGGRIGAIEKVIVDGFKFRNNLADSDKPTPEHYAALAMRHADFWKWYTTERYPTKPNEKPTELKDSVKFAEYWEEYRSVVMATKQAAERPHEEGEQWWKDGFSYRLHNGKVEIYDITVSSEWQVYDDDGR